jgi:catechol-2,3-dioxygenase
MTLGHLGLNVADLTTAKAYYDQLMPALGYEGFVASADEVAYMPAEGKRGTFVFLYESQEAGDYSRDATGLQHLAFMVRTRTDVRDVADLVVELGSTVVHAPQAFPQYGPTYFATFWLDPFGFMLEAVCHHDRD